MTSREQAVKHITDIDTIKESYNQIPVVYHIFKAGVTSDDYHFYCPQCMAERRAKTYTALGYGSQRYEYAPYGLQPGRNLEPEHVDFLIEVTCLQCNYEAEVVGLVRDGQVAVWNLLYPKGGSFATPHAPEGVRFYMDQAQRAFSMAANSAAVSMFRAALEHVLYGLGYETGMLGNKISRLETDLANGSAPPEVARLDPTVLRVLSRLGNASIHANDGTLRAQEAFDSTLVTAFQQALLATFDVLYEEPARARARVARLQAALDATEQTS